MSDLISRQAAIDALTHKWDGMVTSVFDVLKELPSAQPDLNEWCTDCKEYDQEKHCCHRFTKVIRETVEELQAQRWIPCSERLPDKEGRYLCTVGADYHNPREMIYAPDNFHDEDSNTWRSTDGFRVFNWFVIAWMPMPKPYKENEEDEI